MEAMFKQENRDILVVAYIKLEIESQYELPSKHVPAEIVQLVYTYWKAMDVWSTKCQIAMSLLSEKLSKGLENRMGVSEIADLGYIDDSGMAPSLQPTALHLNRRMVDRKTRDELVLQGIIPADFAHDDADDEHCCAVCALRAKKKKKIGARTKYGESSGGGSSNSEYRVGDRVRLTKNRTGIIRYMGKPHFAKDERIGIELDKWSKSGHDGRVGKFSYFSTKFGHGTFATANAIVESEDDDEFTTLQHKHLNGISSDSRTLLRPSALRLNRRPTERKRLARQSEVVHVINAISKYDQIRMETEDINVNKGIALNHWNQNTAKLEEVTKSYDDEKKEDVSPASKTLYSRYYSRYLPKIEESDDSDGDTDEHKKEESRAPKIPANFLCPICREIMQDPVVASDAITYDRKCIEPYLKEKGTFPNTGEKAYSLHVFSNNQLKKEVESYCELNNVCDDEHDEGKPNEGAAAESDEDMLNTEVIE